MASSKGHGPRHSHTRPDVGGNLAAAVWVSVRLAKARAVLPRSGPRPTADRRGPRTEDPSCCHLGRPGGSLTVAVRIDLAGTTPCRWPPVRSANWLKHVKGPGVTGLHETTVCVPIPVFLREASTTRRSCTRKSGQPASQTSSPMNTCPRDPNRCCGSLRGRVVLDSWESMAGPDRSGRYGRQETVKCAKPGSPTVRRAAGLTSGRYCAQQLDHRAEPRQRQRTAAKSQVAVRDQPPGRRRAHDWRLRRLRAVAPAARDHRRTPVEPRSPRERAAAAGCRRS